MKCKKCGRELKKEWKYCPYCGEKIPKIRLPKIFHKEEEVEREIEEEMENMLAAFGFPNIKIKFQTISPRQQQKTATRKQNKFRHINEVLEPKVSVKHVSNEIHISVFLPEVISIDDISINKFEESLEIRAYAGDKMYFKVIPISESSQILKKSFGNQMLKLVLSK